MMEALNVPHSHDNVTTLWEGEVIDFVHHHLWTEKWNASRRIDLNHWRGLNCFAGLSTKQ